MIETGGAVALSEELKTNTVMTTFILESVLFSCYNSLMGTIEQSLCATDNDIGDGGAKLLSESLKVNTTLLHFNLWSLKLISK